jgi:phosphoribosylanthranilate isomerase
MASKETKQIAVAASAVLAQSPVTELRSLRVDEQSNQLQLHGRVRSFYHKQLAQEAVLPLAGGLQVVNRVDVQSVTAQ